MGERSKKDYAKILEARRKRDRVVLNKETCGCGSEEAPEPKPETSWFNSKRPVFTKPNTDTQSLYGQLHGIPAPVRKDPLSNGRLPTPLPLPGGLRFPFKPCPGDRLPHPRIVGLASVSQQQTGHCTLFSREKNKIFYPFLLKRQ